MAKSIRLASWAVEAGDDFLDLLAVLELSELYDQVVSTGLDVVVLALSVNGEASLLDVIVGVEDTVESVAYCSLGGAA